MFDLFDFIADSMNDTARLMTTILYCIPFLLFVALYVLQGIALTHLCKASRAGAVWMAWVPFAKQYLLGRQADVYTEDRVLRGEVSPTYAPSTLRRKMLGFSIVERACGFVMVVAWCIVMLFSFAGLLVALFGGFMGNKDVLDGLDGLGYLLGIGIIILLVFGAIFLIFHILYLVASCKAYYRLLHMLDAPVPALWAVLLCFVPMVTAVVLFVMTMKRCRELTERFFPPMEVSEDAENGEAPPPAKPPMPELYQL